MLLRFALLLIILGSWAIPQPVHASFQKTPAEIQTENSEEKSELQPIAFGKDSNAVEHPVIQKPKPEPKTEQEIYRNKMLPVVWLLLLGIAFLGGMLFLVILLFGARARRIARINSTCAPLRDPLWYLKPNANKPPEAPSDSSEADPE